MDFTFKLSLALVGIHWGLYKALLGCFLGFGEALSQGYFRFLTSPSNKAVEI